MRSSANPPGGPPEFRLDVRAGEQGRTTVAPVGELDIATAEQFRTVVLEQLRAGAVVVDLSGLEFMDSSGVAALDAVLREASASGTPLTVAPEMPEGVTELLRVTGMLGVLPLEERP